MTGKKPLTAAVVFVCKSTDRSCSLRPEFRFKRLYADAIGLNRTIAATFAYLGIDEDSHIRLRHPTALAPAGASRVAQVCS